MLTSKQVVDELVTLLALRRRESRVARQRAAYEALARAVVSSPHSDAVQPITIETQPRARRLHRAA